MVFCRRNSTASSVSLKAPLRTNWDDALLFVLIRCGDSIEVGRKLDILFFQVKREVGRGRREKAPRTTASAKNEFCGVRSSSLIMTDLSSSFATGAETTHRQHTEIPDVSRFSKGLGNHDDAPRESTSVHERTHRESATELPKLPRFAKLLSKYLLHTRISHHRKQSSSLAESTEVSCSNSIRRNARRKQKTNPNAIQSSNASHHPTELSPHTQ